MYENLFSDVIKQYCIKKNYNELPAYLNYMIIKSNPFFEKFFYVTVKSQENYFKEEKPTYYDILKYMCKNFDKLFEKYTNYGSNILIKLQMIQFYNLQPPQAKIFSEFFPLLDNSQYEIKRINDNIVPQFFIDDNNKQNNPFTNKLNQGCDIIPNKRNELIFVESNII